MNITDIVKPVHLLKGSHADTGKTGQGCFMNVIAYLNGEPQITDQSPCVCFVARPIAIWLNDYATDAERVQLLPLIERAMGSRTADKAELIRRANIAGDFALRCKDIAAKAAADAADAAANVAANAANAAADAAADAADAAANVAAYAANAAYAADAAANVAAYAANAADAAANVAYADDMHAELFAAGLACLDAMLPAAAEPAACVIERARELVELQS